MITADFEKKMYDRFIENEELTTKDLLSIGFTNKDLTRLKEKGKLESVRRGVYRLVDVHELFDYSRKLVEKEEYERAELALDRCLEIDSSGTLAARVLSASIGSRNFDRVVKCMERLIDSDNKFYEHDNKLWLFLLRYITELPEDLYEKVDSLTFEDVSVYEEDERYFDIDKANQIRLMILNHEFSEASKVIRETKEFEDNKLYASVLFRLVNYAHLSYGNRRKLYEELILDGNYSQLVNVLNNDNKRWGLTREEKYILAMAKEMVSIEEKQSLPRAKGVSEFTFAEAIKKRNYRLAKEIYYRNIWAKDNNIDTDNSVIPDKILDLMLKKVNAKMDDMKSIQAAKAVGAEEFSKITAALMNRDVDKAFRTMEQYLVQIDKYSYRKYVASLIKLSLLDNDMSFTEPMLALSRLSRKDYQFDVAIYIQDFYFNLTNGNLKRAAIFLDIISCSNDVGDIFIDTTDMREALVNEMKNKGMDEEALAISLPKSKVSNNQERIRQFREELAKDYSMLTDVIDKVLKDDNVALLEPMNGEDTAKVMEILKQVKDIDAFLVDSTDGKSKHVVLKYCGKIKEYIDRGEAIGKAKRAYGIKNYEDCISIYESILPITRRPRGFIYSQLGMSYYETAKGTDFKEAIDYLTLATAACRQEKSNYGFADLVERLKVRSNYNGIKIGHSSNKNTTCENKSIQYVKTDKNN